MNIRKRSNINWRRRATPAWKSPALRNHGLKWAAALLGVLFLAACSAAATNCNQTTFTVNTTADVNDGSCDAAHCSLREAVIAANTCTVHPSYTIEVPTGDYQLSLRGPGDDRGDLDITRNMTIHGEEGDIPHINTDTSWNDRIFDIHSGVEASLNFLWVMNGHSSTNGGGVNNDGTLDMHRIIFSDNVADDHGGGLANSGEASLDFVEFTRNLASQYRGCGGAIYNTGTMLIVGGSIHANDSRSGKGVCSNNHTDGILEIRDSYIQDNGGVYAGLGGLGGGISSVTAALTLDNVTIDNNYAIHGGGIYATAGTIHITDSTINDNHAIFGGGMFIGPTAPEVRVRTTRITHNRAERAASRSGGFSGGLGGGVSISADDFDFDQSPILYNTAEGAGGGMYIETSGGAQGYFTHAAIAYNTNTYGTGGGVTIADGRFLMANATISNNVGLGHGSAYYNESDAESHFVHVTVADNTVSDGADNKRPIFNEDGGTITFFNSLVAGEAGGSGCWGDISGITSLGGNVGYYFSLCVSNHRTDDDSLLFDPVSSVYLPLAEIDGTWVHPLPLESPAAEWVEVPQCNRDDQRLVARPQGAKCEAGAYEMSLEAMSLNDDSITIPTPTSDQPTLRTKVDTGCYKGPGEAWTRYGTLTAGTQAYVIGQGFGGGWLVAYQANEPNIHCWVNLKDVQFDFPLDQLRLIAVPEKPTPTPTLQGPVRDTAVPTVCVTDKNGKTTCH